MSPFSSPAAKSISSIHDAVAPSIPERSLQDILRDRYAEVVQQDQKKHDFIRESIGQTLHLQKENAQLRQAITTLQGSFNTQLHLHERITALTQRIFVLIDGNGLLFHDFLVQAGRTGGRNAADGLIEAVEASMVSVPEKKGETIVKIFLNREAFISKYLTSAHVNRPGLAHQFLHGLVEHPAIDVVDVGPNDGAVLRRFSATFRSIVQEGFYQGIFLGCSHDVRYLRLLESDMHTGFLRTMAFIRCPLVDQEIAHSGFHLQSWDGVFTVEDFSRPQSRDSNATSVHTGGYSMTHGSPCSSNSELNRTPESRTSSISSTGPAPSATPMSFANVAAQKVEVQKFPNPLPPPRPTPLPYSGRVIRNRTGQRIDINPAYDKTEVDRIKKLKLCNMHYLRSSCEYGDACSHQHRYTANAKELQYLTLVARMAPCNMGSSCNDAKCTHGHMCPAPLNTRNPTSTGKNCIFGQDCKFNTDLHSVDRDPVITHTIR